MMDTPYIPPPGYAVAISSDNNILTVYARPRAHTIVRDCWFTLNHGWGQISTARDCVIATVSHHVATPCEPAAPNVWLCKGPEAGYQSGRVCFNVFMAGKDAEVDFSRMPRVGARHDLRCDPAKWPDMKRKPIVH